LPQRFGPDIELCTSMPVHTSCSLVVIPVLQASSGIIVGIIPDEKHGLAVACRVVHIVVNNAMHAETAPQLHAYGRVKELSAKDFSHILFNGHDGFISAKTRKEPAGHVPTQVETANQAPACLIQTSSPTAPAVRGEETEVRATERLALRIVQNQPAAGYCINIPVLKNIKTHRAGPKIRGTRR